MALASILFPASYQDEQLQRQLRSLYEQWRTAYIEAHPQEPVHNITDFRHNPEWRKHFWSVQAAHDCTHLGWRIVRVVWTIMLLI